MEQNKTPEELQEKQMVEIEQMKKDYVTTFSSEAGKQVLANLENICFIHKTTFVKGDSYAAILHEGMRFVVVHIKNMMNMNLETLRKLVAKGE